MPAYYNEFDPYAAQWLRNLISAGLIAPGDVDTRSIEDVTPDDIRGYQQCHFFAGIGVWSYALRQAGWPDDRPVWTGSCPCQPFSAAGKGAGFADERHLWPAWFYLIGECRPAVVFGEQVASKDAEPWLDLVQDDLEALGYALGAVPFPAAGVGAPHIRDRLYWVADSDGRQRRWLTELRGAERNWQDARRSQGSGEPRARRDDGGLADPDGWHSGAERQQRGGEQRQQPQDGGAGGLADAEGKRERSDEPRADSGEGLVVARPEQGRNGRDDGAACGWTGPVNGLWRDADWLLCKDARWRPVEPGTFPLAHGAPARVGRLRGYGNAICAPAAVAWIEAYLDTKTIEQRVRLEGVFA